MLPYSNLDKWNCNNIGQFEFLPLLYIRNVFNRLNRYGMAKNSHHFLSMYLRAFENSAINYTIIHKTEEGSGCKVYNFCLHYSSIEHGTIWMLSNAKKNQLFLWLFYEIMQGVSLGFSNI